MATTRARLTARLRRAQIVAGAVLVLLTAGLSAAVARVIPGRDPLRDPHRTEPNVDPFTERLTAFPPTGADVAPRPTDAAPVAISGAS